ncbi:hypothetical protein ACFE04_027991 [Oxalis oulophora]
METTTDLISSQVNGPDFPKPSDHDHDPDPELQSLRDSYQGLLSNASAMEEKLLLIERQRDEAILQNVTFTQSIQQLSLQIETLRDKVNELQASEEDSRNTIERLESEARNKDGILVNKLDLIKDCMVKLVEGLEDDEEQKVIEERKESQLDEVKKAIWEEKLVEIETLARDAEVKFSNYKGLKKKEKKELENSVMSLTEENRDINNLLRVALVEKEVVERKLKGGNAEQKRVALLQIAERGLHRVGFGFMMGGGNAEHMLENSAATTSAASSSGNKSDGSECEEEVVSLASTVERIMKNLRLEITQLRRSLEESRSDNERLQSLTEKQAQTIEENKMYIKELEDRERVLVQNVEELLTEIKETEAEVGRWREACELEVTAGKNEVEERDKLVMILKQELEKTKAALETANGKLKLKEKLAAAAMAAQAAAETSLQLTDSRAAGLRERIEELTKQLEEAEKREKNSRKSRRLCWPWRPLKLNPVFNNGASPRFANTKHMLPEMQALLQ